MSGHRMIIELEREGLIRLPDLPGTRVACLDGAIWVTQDQDPNDIVLEPGASYQIKGKGAIALALHDSRFAIEAPDGVPGWPGFVYPRRAGLPAMA